MSNTEGEAQPSAPAAEEPRDMLWLLGQPHLADYLDYVRRRVVGGHKIHPAELADEWRAANDIYYDLEKTEAGIADKIGRRPVPKVLAPLVKELEADAYFKRAFDTLPTAIEMVELEKLVVSQQYIEPGFAAKRASQLGDDYTPAQLFHFCQPLERANPPVRVQRLSNERYLFSSRSTDIRAHHPVFLQRHQIDDIGSFGPVSGAIALMVGFGSNFLTAIRSGDRMMLHNGYHRAWSLVNRGIKYAPCIVETVTRKDELKLSAGSDVSDDPEFYFAARRPPLLKDFFDPRLAKSLKVRSSETTVEVEFKMRSWTSTDWSGEP